MTNSLALLVKGSLPDGIDRPNFMAISTKVMAGNLSPSELFDLNTTFWRDPAGSVHPLPNSRGRDANGFSHAINVSEEVDGFRDIHNQDCKPLVNSTLTIAQIYLLDKNEQMVNINETEWLAARIREALATSGLTQTAVAERCGVSRAAVTMWGKRGTIKKSLLPQIALATGRPLEFFILGANATIKTSSKTENIINKITRLDSLGLLSDEALNGLMSHLNSYDPGTQAVAEQPNPDAKIEAPRVDQVPANVVAEDESFLKQQMIKKTSKKSA